MARKLVTCVALCLTVLPANASAALPSREAVVFGRVFGSVAPGKQWVAECENGLGGSMIFLAAQQYRVNADGSAWLGPVASYQIRNDRGTQSYTAVHWQSTHIEIRDARPGIAGTNLIIGTGGPSTYDLVEFVFASWGTAISNPSCVVWTGGVRYDFEWLPPGDARVTYAHDNSYASVVAEQVSATAGWSHVRTINGTLWGYLSGTGLAAGTAPDGASVSPGTLSSPQEGTWSFSVTGAASSVALWALDVPWHSAWGSS